jgi:plastocyanin
MTVMKPYVLAAGAAVSILLAACSSSSPTTGTAPAPVAAPSASAGASQGSGGIVIASFAYSGTMTVKPGQEVTVTNQDSTAHTVTDKKSQLFDTGSIEGSGGKGKFKAPDKPGTYPFGCKFHPGMAGTLTVQG